jgi:hypothetical protein
VGFFVVSMVVLRIGKSLLKEANALCVKYRCESYNKKFGYGQGFLCAGCEQVNGGVSNRIQPRGKK